MVLDSHVYLLDPVFGELGARHLQIRAHDHLRVLDRPAQLFVAAERQTHKVDLALQKIGDDHVDVLVLVVAADAHETQMLSAGHGARVDRLFLKRTYEKTRSIKATGQQS